MRRSSLFISLFMFVISAFAQDALQDLLLAAKAGELPKVQAGLRAGMDPDTSDPQGNTLLIIAAREGHLDLAKLLLDQRAKVRERNAFGDSALMLAALHGHLELVRLLAAYGGEVNGPGWTPLHYCAWGGYTEVCSLLVGLGANVNARAPNLTTPLMMASREGRIDTARWLLQHGADPQLKNDADATALDWALKYKQTEVAQLLKSGTSQGCGAGAVC